MQKKAQIEELTTKLDDIVDENSSIKKKTAANIKDLTRQLQLLQKKLDQTNSIQTSQTAVTATSSAPALTSSSKLGLPPPLVPTPMPTSNSSNLMSHTNSSIPHVLTKSSRTSSLSSLNDKDSYFNAEINNKSHEDEDDRSLASDSISISNNRSHNQILSGSNEDDVYVVDIDKQKVIEKICKLQKMLAKRNEKIDFLQEHVSQLTVDLKRKTRYETCARMCA